MTPYKEPLKILRCTSRDDNVSPEMRRDHAYLKQSGLRIIATEHINDRTAGFRLDGLTVIEFAAEVEVYIMINGNLWSDRELLDLYNLVRYAIKLLINWLSLSASLLHQRPHIQILPV